MGWPRKRAYPTVMREAILRRDPVCRCKGCRHCEVGCRQAATEADHIVPVAEGGRDTMANGQGLCAGCHAWKTRQETIRGMNRWKLPAERHPGLL